MSRRGVTPTLESSQQSHIDDLVQRNRTLDHTNRKLRDELAQEKSRAKSVVQDLKNKHDTRIQEWRNSLDAVQASHLIHHFRSAVELEKEKSSIFVEQEKLREAKIAALRRDSKITAFQIKEAELERRVDELDDELAELRELREGERRTSKATISELSAHLRLQEEQFAAAEQAKADAEAELDELHKANAEQQASSGSLSVKLERAQLQLDGERTRVADLERANDELRRTNEELKRQVEKWKSLESKGDTEAESSRRKRVKLEVQLQTMQNQLTKREDEAIKVSEVAERKIQKMKRIVQQWEENSGALQEQVEELRKKLAKAERENKKLLSQGNAQKPRTSTPKVNSPNESEEEDEVAFVMGQVPASSPAVGPSRQKASSAKPSSRPAPRQNRKASAPPPSTSRRAPPDPDTDDDIQEIPVPNTAKGKGKAKATDVDDTATRPESKQRPTRSATRAKHTPASAESATDTQIDAIPPEALATAGKRKNTKSGGVAPEEEEPAPNAKRKGKRKASPPPSVDEAQEESMDTAATTKRKGKRKASRSPSADEASEESRAAVPPKRSKRSADAGPPKVNGRGAKVEAPRTAPASRAESTASTVTVTENEASGSGAQKPVALKKRKINLFPTASKTNLADFNFGSQGSGIPSVLSPLKPGEPVPARSTSSFLSSFLRRN